MFTDPIKHRSAAPLLLGCISVLTAPRLISPSILWDPPVLLVRYGGSFNVTCRTSCPSAPTSAGIETSSRYEVRTSGSAWELMAELQEVTEWRSSVQCYFRCGTGRDYGKQEMTAYRPLDPPVVPPLPPLRSGRPHPVSCHVGSVFPIHNLTLTLFMADTPVHTTDFRDRAQSEPEDAMMTQEVTASLEDHGKSVACRAVLDLRPHGPLYERDSMVQRLEVYDFPYPPTLSWTPPITPKIPNHLRLETGQELNVTCATPKAFPAPNITLWTDGLTLNGRYGADGSYGVTGLYWDRPGVYRVTCRAAVGPEEKREEVLVHVDDFPPPQLSIIPPSPLLIAQHNVSGLCQLTGGRPEGAELRLLGDRGDDEEEELVSWRPAPLPFTLMVDEGHDGTRLRCQARMEPGGAQKWSRDVTLNVSAPPKMDDTLCPPTRQWPEGQEVTSWCVARGKPVPEVTCQKEGSDAILDQRPGPVKREHSGTYWCQATNRVGTDRKMVHVTIEYWDVNVGLLVALSVLAAVGAAAALVVYRLYYRSKKIRRYELRDKQQRHLLDGRGNCKEPGRPAVNGAATGEEL